MASYLDAGEADLSYAIRTWQSRLEAATAVLSVSDPEVGSTAATEDAQSVARAMLENLITLQNGGSQADHLRRIIRPSRGGSAGAGSSRDHANLP